MACAEAEAEGFADCYVARTGRVATEPQTRFGSARGGRISPGNSAGPSPMKREGSTEPPQTRKGLAVAA